MSNIIDDILEQCTEYYGERGDVYVDQKKFAELIIQECMKQARSVGDLRGATDDMIYGADIAALQISKYFGVNNENS